MIRWDLAAAAAVPLTPPEALLQWGAVLVLAPHPDDEALGCGGAIALLRQAGVPVEIAWLTDGRHSHPNSRRWPADRLIALRQAEALEAAAALGVGQTHFFLLEDARVPLPPEDRTLGKLCDLLGRVQTVLTTWRFDPHCDHRAAYEYVQLAARRLPLRLLEFPVWVWQNGTLEDHPLKAEFDVLRLDITRVLPQKRRAVAAHRSQITGLIDDDPAGFRLAPEMLRHFDAPWEIYLVPRT